MPFLSAALDSGDYTLLESNHQDKWLIIPNPNTVVFKCRVNQSVFADSLASFVYDSVTVGSESAVLTGFTVLISHTDNINAHYFRGRVRKVPAGNTFYVNRNSSAIEDNDYVFVIKDIALQEKMPGYIAGVLYFDDDIAFRQLLPGIRSIRSVYYARLSGGVADFAIAPDVLWATSGSTAGSYAWSADGGSFQSGGSSSKDVTLRYTSAGVYYPRFSATDSGGRTNWFSPMVIVNDANNSIVARNVFASTIRGDVSAGWSASIECVKGSDLAGILDETQIVIVSEEQYGNTPGSFLSNIRFVGRLREESLTARVSLEAGIKSNVAYEVDGLMAQLGRLVLTSFAMKWVTSPTRVGEIKNMTLWRAMLLIATELTTLSNIAPVSWDNETDDYSIPLLTNEERGAGDSIATSGYAINAILCCASDNTLHIARHMNYLSTTDKAALTTVAQFTKKHWAGTASLNRQLVDQVGRVTMFAGSFNTTSGDVTALRALVPAQVFGRGQGRSTVNSQVLKVNLSLEEMKAETALRAGAEYAAKNQQTILTVTQRGAYAWQQPNVFQRYNWLINADDPVTGLVERSYGASDYWWLRSISISHRNDRALTECQSVYVLDIRSVPAKVVAELAPEEIVVSTPSLPPWSMSPFPMLDSLKFPDWTDIAPEEEQPYTEEEAKDAAAPPKTPTDEPESEKPQSDKPEVKGGSVVLIGNSASVWESRNFSKSASPTWNDITPGSGHTHGVYDPFSGGAYVIANDGVDSYFWRCGNTTSPEWQSATLTDNVFKYIRPVSAAGKLYVYAPAGILATWAQTFNFIESDGAWIEVVAAVPPGSYTEDTGWEAEFSAGTNIVQLAIEREFDATTITGVSITYTADAGSVASDSGRPRQIRLFNDATLVATQSSTIAYGTDVVYAWTGSVTATKVDVTLVPANRLSSSAPFVNGTAVLTSVTITGIGINPFTGGSADSAVTRYSTDRGATFATAVEVGTAVVDGGSSTLRTGDTIFAAANEEIATADAGGAYTGDETTTGTHAACIWGYGKGSNRYLYAPAAAIGGETLFKVDGSALAISPSDGSNKGIAISANCICTAPENDGVIFFLGSFGGVTKLARSTNGGSSWNITTGMSGATYVRAKNANQVYIAADGNVLYSEDGGVTFVAKDAPGGSLLWIEVR